MFAANRLIPFDEMSVWCIRSAAEYEPPKNICLAQFSFIDFVIFKENFMIKSITAFFKR